MRPLNVLVTSAPARGNLWDLVPIGWALRSRGHDVRVATLPSLLDHVKQTSLLAMPAGTGTGADASPATSADGADERFIPGGDEVAWLSVVLARGLVRLLDFFRPDLVVHEPADLAGPLIAQRLGVPYVCQDLGPPLRPAARQAPAAVHEELCREVGMGTAVSPPALIIDVRPPRLKDLDGPGDGQAAPRQPMRFVPFNGPSEVPAWLHEQPKGPRVCVALATGRRGHGLAAVSRVLQALRAVDGAFEVIVPVCEQQAGQIDMTGNERPVAWLPFELLARSCRLVVHQGGFAATMTALGLGVPQLILPVSEDERTLANVVERCGAGRQAGGDSRETAASARSLLRETGYRQAAAAIAAEMASQPSPMQVAAVIEQLAFDHDLWVPKTRATRRYS
jgi:UDP:flavonoid glycosyltransferase YjiC (YdhE family)